MFEIIVETLDRSYYTDRLEELTGKPRRYWSLFPFCVLKHIYIKEIKRKGRVMS